MQPANIIPVTERHGLTGSNMNLAMEAAADHHTILQDVHKQILAAVIGKSGAH